MLESKALWRGDFSGCGTGVFDDRYLSGKSVGKSKRNQFFTDEPFMATYPPRCSRSVRGGGSGFADLNLSAMDVR
jgi:hypothetical protein